MIKFIFAPFFGGLGTIFPCLLVHDDERGADDEV
jgi:hypothetical protein